MIRSFPQFFTKGFINLKINVRRFSRLTFEEAKVALNSLKTEPDNEVKLKIYGLYKQATSGDCTSEKPGMLDFVAKAKWHSWFSLKGMCQEEASSAYANLISNLIAQESTDKSDSTSEEKSSNPNSSKDIRCNLDTNGVMQIVLNRPAKKNALTWEMYEQWASFLDSAATDPDVKVVAVMGTGDYFSSGNDLTGFTKPLQSGSSLKDIAQSARTVLHKFVASFIDFPKPLIGLINGPAVGITVTTLALYDYVLSVNTATFHTPLVTLGQTPEGCSSVTFPRIMRRTKANEMLLLCRRVTAEEARDIGLINEVCPPVNFSERGSQVLKEFCALPPNALRNAKEVMRFHDSATLHTANNIECDRIVEMWTSPECIQAVTNFVKRRSA